MKTRQGFVSNSSSSSFILYGASFEKCDLEEIVFDKNHELELMVACGITDLEAFREEWDNTDTWDFGDIVAKIQPMFEGMILDEGFGENEELRVGLLEDPEYLSVSQVKNGLWKEEDIEKVETMLKRFNRQARVSGGTWYN